MATTSVVLAPKMVQEQTLEHIVWPYRLALPLMWVLGLYVHAKKIVWNLFRRTPTVNCWLVDALSVQSRKVKEGAARWPALDVVYNFESGQGANSLLRAIDSFWMHVRNAQAVRNRLKIVKEELSRAIENRSLRAGGDETVRVLSLACGSAQGVIEVVRDLRHRIRIEVLLVDQDASALRYAKDLARKEGVYEQFRFEEGNVLFFQRYLHGFKPDIIEMLGLMDYLDTKLAVALVRKIRLHLAHGGTFLTCHVHPNGERYFLKHVVDWDMLYRTPTELKDILVDGGFLEVRLRTEPHGIHSVAIAEKE